MNKKIGILSFPTACNHGAFLQVYALRGFLMSNGLDVEIINYRNRKHFYNELKSMFIKKDLKLIYFNLLRYLSFKKAQKVFDMKKMVFKATNIHSEKYDFIIIGGDIVWDFSNPYLGHDPIFFGHNLKANKLLTYAASAGSSKVENMPSYVRDGLKNFLSMGVRDEESLKISSHAKFSDTDIVLDTTLIYDFQVNEKRKFKDKYILLYSFEMTEDDKKQIIEYAASNSLKVVSITFNKNYIWADKNYYSIHPLEILNLIKHASYIYTSTFHGLLLSIKYRKKVALRNNETIKSKCGWLIDILNIKKIDINNSKNLDHIWSKENIYTNEFETVFTNLVEKSKAFLKNNINY